MASNATPTRRTSSTSSLSSAIDIPRLSRPNSPEPSTSRRRLSRGGDIRPLPVPPLQLNTSVYTSHDDPLNSSPTEENTRYMPYSSAEAPQSTASLIPPTEFGVRDDDEAFLTQNMAHDEDEADLERSPHRRRKTVRYSTSPSPLRRTGSALFGVSQNLRRVSMRVVNTAAVGLENQVMDQVDAPTEVTLARASSVKKASLRGRALGILGPTNPLRVAFFHFLQYPWTEPAILALIIVNAIVLTVQASKSFTVEALELPIVGYFHTWEDYALFGLFVLFTLEAFARICVSGFLLDPEIPISQLFTSPFAETVKDTNSNIPFPVSPVDGPVGPLTRGLSLTDRLRRFNSNMRRPFALGQQRHLEIPQEPQHPEPTTLAAKRRSHFRQFSMTRDDINLPPALERAHTQEVITLPFMINVNEAQGKIERNVPYLRHSWSRIDFVAIIGFWTAFTLAMVGVERGQHHIGIFRGLSVLRVSRLLSITAGTTTIMHSLKRARHLLLNVLYFVIFAMILFSIIGIQSFKGSLRRSCYISPMLGEDEIQIENQFCGGHIDPDTLQIVGYIPLGGTNPTTFPKGYICPLGQVCKADSNPNSNAESFDTIYNSALQIVITASANGWTPLMYNTIDSEFFISSVFYIFCVVIINFWLMNLFVAVITSSFSAIRSETKKSAFGASAHPLSAPESDWESAGRRPTSKNWAQQIVDFFEWAWVLLALASLILQATRTTSTDDSGMHNLLLSWGELGITIAFDVEIVLRFLASLPDWRSFFTHGRNWLDLFIAIVCSIIQIPPIRNSAVYEWFTIFQLMRFYRVILVFPRMKPLLLSVFGNITGLANMTLFMLLVNYVSSLVAVQLLRGDLPGDEVINFGELYNAFLGVYQVFSSENWTDILYDSINAEAGLNQAVIIAIFWSIWVFFSNFIMLQMFIAVINENFEVSEEAKESRQASHYWAMHKPAGESTPEWVKKLNPYRWVKGKGPEDAFERDRMEEQRTSISNPFKRLSTIRNPFSHNKPPAKHQPNKSLSALQKLFSGGEEEDYDIPLQPIRHKRMSTFASSTDPLDWEAEKNFELLESVTARDRAVDLHSATYNERLARKARFIQQHPTYDKTFWIFSQSNFVRRACQLVVKPANGRRIFGTPTSPILEPVFLLILLIAVVAGIAVESYATPLYRREYYRANGLSQFSWFDLCELSFGGVLVVEFLIKIVADGFLFTPNAYMLSIWNIFDFAVLIGLAVNLSTALAFAGGLSRLTRSLKALRVLRLITLIGKMRDTFESLIISGASRIFDAAILAMLYMIPYAVWGLNIFHGKMNECNDGDAPGLSGCTGEFATTVHGESFGFLVPRAWDNPYPSTQFSFDDFSSSLLILFEIVSLEGWIDVMYIANSITGRDSQPSTNVSQENAIFFLVYHLLGGVVILTLFVSIIISNFRNKTGSALLTQAQREWIDLQKLFKRQKPSKRPRVRPTMPVRAWCFDRAVQKHGWWSRTMTVLFVVHIIGLMTQTFTVQAVVDDLRNSFFLAITFIYMIDVLVRLYGLGFYSYCANGWNIFDAIVVVGSFATTMAVRFGASSFVTDQLQKLFLVSIAFKLVQRNDSLNMLFKTAVASLPTIVSLLALWLILFIFFAIMYVEVFSLTKWGTSEDHNKNYTGVANALVMLAFMSAGEGWNAYMHDFGVIYPRCTNSAGPLQESDCGSVAWAFSLFIAWNVLSMYIFVNLFTGVVVESFSYVFQQTRSGALAITREEMRSFKKLWAEYSHPETGMIERSQLVSFLGRLSGAFEVRVYPREYEVQRLMAICKEDADSQDLVVDGINIRKLNMVLKTLDPKVLRQRSHRYNRIYHEAMSHLRDYGGINFTKMLLLLAHHKLIVEDDALTMNEYVKRMEVTREVKKLVYVDRVRSCLKTISLRRRFLAHRAKLLEQDMPAIVVETPESPPTSTRDIAAFNPSSPSPSSPSLFPQNRGTFSPPFSPPIGGGTSSHRSQLSDASMLSVDIGHNRSFSQSSSDDPFVPNSAHSSMWTEMLEAYQPPADNGPSSRIIP